MARPPSKGPKAVATGVSLYPSHIAKLARLGGSAWLQALIDATPEGMPRLFMPSVQVQVVEIREGPTARHASTVILACNGKKTKPLDPGDVVTFDAPAPISPFPLHGDVAFVFESPPCKGFDADAKAARVDRAGRAALREAIAAGAKPKQRVLTIFPRAGIVRGRGPHAGMYKVFRTAQDGTAGDRTAGDDYHLHAALSPALAWKGAAEYLERIYGV